MIHIIHFGNRIGLFIITKGYLYYSKPKRISVCSDADDKT
jgi:hypothetical protein